MLKEKGRSRTKPTERGRRHLYRGEPRGKRAAGAFRRAEQSERDAAHRGRIFSSRSGSDKEGAFK